MRNFIFSQLAIILLATTALADKASDRLAIQNIIGKIKAAPVTSEIGYYKPALQPTGTVPYNGLNLAIYESSGTRTPAILMIHGNTSSANSFEKIFNSALGKNRKVIIMDLPGYGNSDNAAPGDYSVGFFANAIATVATHVGADNGVLVGWSLGGDLAIQASTLLPNLKGLFAFGTPPIGFDPGLPPPFLGPAESYAGDAVNFGAVANLTPIQISDYANAFFRPAFGRVPRFFINDGLRTDPNTRQAVLNAVLGLDPTFQDEVVILQNIQIPVALVIGGQDAFINPAYFTAVDPTFPTLFTGQTITLPKTGHAVQFERQVVFNSLLRQFIRSL